MNSILFTHNTLGHTFASECFSLEHDWSARSAWNPRVARASDAHMHDTKINIGRRGRHHIPAVVPVDSPMPGICAHLPCSSRCCLERSVARAGKWDGLENPVSAAATLNLTLFGNSVAMSNNFASTRAFAVELGANIGRQVSFGYAPSKGGIDASHERYCGLGGAEYSQLFVIQYNRFRGEAGELVSYLRSQPHQSLITSVSHCAVTMFTKQERGDCEYKACQLSEVRDAGSNVNAASQMLARRRGVDVHVDLCAAFRVLLHGECGPELAWTRRRRWPEESNARFARLYEEFYNINDSATNTCGRAKPKNRGVDAVHLSRYGDLMLGCLLARAVAAAMRHPQTNHSILPKASRGAARARGTAISTRGSPVATWPKSHTMRRRTWCFSQDGRSPAISPVSHSPEWVLIDPDTGKPPQTQRDGPMAAPACVQNKHRHRIATSVWRATAPGAKMTFHIPHSSSLSAELYHHHSHRMGSLQVKIEGVVSTVLDTCCPTHCLRQFPNQGFTFLRLIATDIYKVGAHVGFSTAAAGHLRVEVVALPSNESSCAPSNISSPYQLDLFSLMGESADLIRSAHLQSVT